MVTACAKPIFPCGKLGAMEKKRGVAQTPSPFGLAAKFLKVTEYALDQTWFAKQHFCSIEQ